MTPPKYRLYFEDGDHLKVDGRTEFGARRCQNIMRNSIPKLTMVKWPPIGPAWLLVRVTAEEADDIITDENPVIRTGWETYTTPQEIIQITSEKTGAFEISDSDFKDGGKSHDIAFVRANGIGIIMALTDAELDDLAIAVLRRISEREFYRDTPEAPTADPGS